MGTIYYVCANCEEHAPESACFPRDMVRVAKDGEWICENCFVDAPHWTYMDRPQGFNEDEDDVPRWSDLPEVPKYVPETALTIG